MPSYAVKIYADTTALRKDLDNAKGLIVTTTASMERLGASFKGERLIQSAHDTVAAIQQIGGASMLTAREAEQALGRIERAMEKLRVTGQQVPPGMRETADSLRMVANSTTAVVAPMSAMTTNLSALASQFGITFGAAGIGMAVRSTLDYADSIGELAAGAGVSAEAIQGLGYAAKQNGADINVMANTLMNLAERVGSADEKTRIAVDGLGVSFESLKAMSPDQMFVTIAQALRNTEDASTRNALAMDVLGKTWKQVMPTVMTDFERLIQLAPKMSDTMVKSLGDTRDRLDEISVKSKVFAGSILDTVIPAIDKLGEHVGKMLWAGENGNLIDKLTMVLRLGGQSGDVLAEALGGTNFESGMPIPGAPKAFGQKSIVPPLTMDLEQVKAVEKALAEQLKTVQAEDAAVKGLTQTYLEFGKDAGQALGWVSDQWKEIERRSKDQADLIGGLMRDVARGRGVGADEYDTRKQEAAARRQAELDKVARALGELGLSGQGNSDFEVAMRERTLQIEREYQVALQKIHDDYLISLSSLNTATKELAASLSSGAMVMGAPRPGMLTPMPGTMGGGPVFGHTPSWAWGGALNQSPATSMGAVPPIIAGANTPIQVTVQQNYPFMGQTGMAMDELERLFEEVFRRAMAKRGFKY